MYIYMYNIIYNSLTSYRPWSKTRSSDDSDCYAVAA